MHASHPPDQIPPLSQGDDKAAMAYMFFLRVSPRSQPLSYRLRTCSTFTSWCSFVFFVRMMHTYYNTYTGETRVLAAGVRAPARGGPCRGRAASQPAARDAREGCEGWNRTLCSVATRSIHVHVEANTPCLDRFTSATYLYLLIFSSRLPVFCFGSPMGGEFFFFAPAP